MWLFFTVSRVCLQFVIVVFPDYTHLQFLLKVFECFMWTTEIVSEYDQETARKSHTTKTFNRSGRCKGYLRELLNWQLCHCVGFVMLWLFHVVAAVLFSLMSTKPCFRLVASRVKFLSANWKYLGCYTNSANTTYASFI